ncbi:MAG TPA: restriction endonuclease [Verrucomicrobiae bacterium]|nr:restriction endonuclease [Verrucomicrobiae bacterium]
MDIEFSCSHCGQSLVIDEAGAGTSIDCPKCAKPVYVPSAPVKTSNTPPPVLAQTPKQSLGKAPNISSISKPLPLAKIFFWLSIALVFFALFKGSGKTFLLGFGCAILTGGILLVSSAQRKARQVRSKSIALANGVIDKHANALLINRLRKRKVDDYGIVLEEQWRKEIEYFCQKVLMPLLGAFYQPFLEAITWRSIGTRPTDARALANAYANAVYNWVDKRLDEHSKTKPFSKVNVAALDPTGYEAYCAHILNETGWQTTTTSASGDQGIDIIAMRNGKKAVFQCKLYHAFPVGNAAVQEANAGKAYAKADYAFVVSNAEFTPSAVELANTCGVHLIHHGDLADLDRYL